MSVSWRKVLASLCKMTDSDKIASREGGRFANKPQVRDLLPYAKFTPFLFPGSKNGVAAIRHEPDHVAPDGRIGTYGTGEHLISIRVGVKNSLVMGV